MAGAPTIPKPPKGGRAQRAAAGGGSEATSAIKSTNIAPRIKPMNTRMYGKVPGPAEPSPFSAGGFGPMGGLPGSE